MMEEQSLPAFDLAQDSVVQLKTAAPGTPQPAPYMPPYLSSPTTSAPSSPMASYPGSHASSPQMASQLMQMQSQMSMMSQVMAMQQQQRTPDTSSRDSMLCFSLGERLGALNKHEEVTSHGLKDLQASVNDSTGKLSKIRETVKMLETNMKHMQSTTAHAKKDTERVGARVQEIGADVLALTKDCEHDRAALRDVTERHERMQQTVQTNISDVREQMVERRHEHATLAAQVAQQSERLGEVRKLGEGAQEKLHTIERSLQTLESGIASDRARADDQAAQVSLRIDGVEREASAALERSDREHRSMVDRHMKEIERALKQMERHVEAREHEMRSQLMQMQHTVQQHQGQLMAFSSGGTMGGGVGGSLLALLLQGMLPFVPYESVHGIVQYVFSLVQPLSSSPSFKGVWTAAVACSIAARVLNRFFPLVARLLSAIIGIEGMSASSRWALSLARIVLEVGLALQLYAFVAMHVRKYCSELSEKTSAWLERIRRGIATAALVMVYVGGPLLLATLVYYNRAQLRKLASTVPPALSLPAMSVPSITLGTIVPMSLSSRFGSANSLWSSLPSTAVMRDTVTAKAQTLWSKVPSWRRRPGSSSGDQQ